MLSWMFCLLLLCMYLFLQYETAIDLFVGLNLVSHILFQLVSFLHVQSKCEVHLMYF